MKTDPDNSGQSLTALLVKKKFGPLFATSFLTAFNDNLLKNAIIILITFRAASVLGIPPAAMVSVAGGIFIFPFLASSATAGQLADKYRKASLIRRVKLAEIVIMAMAAWGFATDQLDFLLLTLFLMGIHSAFFGPLKFSILSQQLEDTEFLHGVALIEAGTFLAILMGTITGGLLVLIPEHGPTWVSATLFLTAAVGYGLSWLIPEVSPSAPDLAVSWAPIGPTLEIVRSVRRSRVVYLSILGISWFWFFGATLLSLIPPFCKDVLHADETVVTLFLACFSIGIGFGSTLCSKLSKTHIELGFVPLGAIGMSAFSFDLWFSGAFPAPAAGLIGATEFLHATRGLHLILDMTLLSMFSGFYTVPLLALMQHRSEGSRRSRTIAANNIVNASFMIFSAVLVVGLVRLGLTIPQMFLVIALLNVAFVGQLFRRFPEVLHPFVAWLRPAPKR